MDALATLTVDDFAPHQGDTFRVLAATGEIEVELAEVRRLGQAAREGDAFSLLFLSAPGPFLAQGIYGIVHPALGTLDIFIVPLGPQRGRNAYEAIFT
jgi:uncharacterized protein DUF6916